MAYYTYDKAMERHYERIEFRLRRQKNKIEGEWFDGVHIDPETVPEGWHHYETRHSDYCDNLSLPASIRAINGQNDMIVVNFCGTVLTREPIKLKSVEDGITRNSVGYL